MSGGRVNAIGMGSRWRGAARRSTLRDGRLLDRLEARLAIDRADLDMILAVVLLARELLRRPMLGIGPPRAHAFLVLELDDRHPLAVVGEEALMGDVAWHRPGEFVHPIGQRDVFVADARAQA